jgi:gliding motility-associated-like protein
MKIKNHYLLILLIFFIPKVSYSQVTIGDLYAKATKLDLNNLKATCQIFDSISLNGNIIDDYKCPNVTAKYVAGEKLYYFDIEKPCTLQIALYKLTFRPAFFLFRTNEPIFISNPTGQALLQDANIECIINSSDLNGVRAPAISQFVQPGRYWISVDSRETSNVFHTFYLDITCGNLNCGDCDYIQCNSNVKGTTIGLQNNSSIYNPERFDQNFSEYISKTGPEKTYCFSLKAASNVEINLKNFNQDLDLILLSDCNLKKVVAVSEKQKLEQEQIIRTLPAGNYYIVVDGHRCSESDFTLELKATNCCEITAITNPAIGKDCKTFQLSGSIPESCGAIIIERGFVWALKPDPNLQNGTKIPEFPQGGIGQFGYDLVTNISDTTYYYRAYAVTSSGNIILGIVRSLKSGNCCLSSTEILQVPLYKDIVDNKCKNLQDSSIGIYSAQYNGQLVYFAFHSNYNYFVVTDCAGKVLYECKTDCNFVRQSYLRAFSEVDLIYSCPGRKDLCYIGKLIDCTTVNCVKPFVQVCGCDGVTYSSCLIGCIGLNYVKDSCSTNCNLDLCDKENWLYTVFNSLGELGKTEISIFKTLNYVVISYEEPFTPSTFRGKVEVIYNCDGKLIQKCTSPIINENILGIFLPSCEFFSPYSQLEFPFGNEKIDTLVFKLKSKEEFSCDDLKCGSVRYGNTANGLTKFNQYLCSYNLMGGKEIIYEFDKKANQSAVFHLSEVVRDLDLFVLSKNDEDFCVKHSSKDGQSYDNIFLEASLPAGTYYVVVDGFNNNTSTYKLTVQCDKPEGNLDCNKAKSINCNESQSGNTSMDGVSMNQFYGSSSSVFYDGKEVIYKLIAPFDGVIDILLENLNTDLDLFVFDDCGNKLNPLEFSIEANKEEEAILLSVLKGKSYFIVIDSRFEMEGNFTLSITCTDCTCNNPPCVPPPPLICQDKIQLFCNVPKLGDTRTSNYQRIKQYGCGGVAKGKELLYYFELESAQTVDIFIRNILPGNNLKLIVLDSCNPYTAKCLASGNKSNESNEAIRLNLAKGIYHIYVDGYLDKDASSFEIEIKCEDIDCDKNPIMLSFDTSNVNCYYNIEVKPKDGVPPYTYKWSTGETLSKLTGVPPGKYVVTVTDKKLCSKVDSVLVNSSCKPACGVAIKGNTEFGKSNYYKYDCSDHKMDGNEIIYEFDNPSTQNVVISLTDLVQDLDLFLLEYVTPMNPDRCVKSSTRTDGSYESIFVENLPKGKYYIVVEGYNKRESSFTLKIDCPKPRGFLDCANAQIVDCNKTYSGNTKSGKANNNYYGADSPVFYNGKELVYKFVAPQGAAEVIAFLENLTSDVDFFVVDNCGNPVSSFSASTESNLSDEAILFYPVAGRTYYFVVDSPEGLEGSYNLRLTCTGTCNGCPPSPPFNCNKKTLLICNTPLADNNFNGESRNNSYCTGVALGKEKLYYFEIKTAQEVEIILSKINPGKNLNIYLLNQCEPSGKCLAVGNKSLDSDDVIIKNLAAGIYYIWVDGFKASDESTYTIEVRCKDIDCSIDPISLAGNIIPVSCGINDLKVTVVKGGIPPFTYKWSTGETTDILKNAKAGTYTVTVTDKRFCNQEFIFNIPVLPPLTLSSIVTISNCKYNITINPAGGKPPYRYSWKDGATTNPRTNLPAGTYAVTVSDASNCQKDTTFVLVPLELNITQKIDSADCGKANGRIEVVTVNKIKSAVWQDNTTNSLVREKLKPGKYTLTLTDVNGCIKTIVFEVGEKDNCSCDFYTAISPNGDGKNDYFFIDCKKKGCSDVLKVCFPENEVIIFNRWGNVVFKAEPYENDWDAQGLPDGVYYYQFRRDPNSKVEKGSIIVKGN